MAGVRMYVDPFRERQDGVSGPCADHDVRDTVRCQVCDARVSGGVVGAVLTDACLFHQPVQAPTELIGLVRMAQLSSARLIPRAAVSDPHHTSRNHPEQHARAAPQTSPRRPDQRIQPRTSRVITIEETPGQNPKPGFQPPWPVTAPAHARAGQPPADELECKLQPQHVQDVALSGPLRPCPAVRVRQAGDRGHHSDAGEPLGSAGNRWSRPF